MAIRPGVDKLPGISSWIMGAKKKGSILCTSDTSCMSFLEPVSTLIILPLKGEWLSVKQDKLGCTVVGAVNCPLSPSDSAIAFIKDSGGHLLSCNSNHDYLSNTLSLLYGPAALAYLTGNSDILADSHVSQCK